MRQGGRTGSRVAILVRSPLWRVAGLRPVERARQAARAVLASDAPRCGAPADLTIVLAGDGEVRELNRRWRGRNQATNILSFPSKAAGPGGRLLLGDVILAFETIAREAKAARKPVGDHLSHLVVHGVLHLLGYDHEKPAEARRMEGVEVRVLAGLGISDPYAPLRPPSCPGRQ
ncbi:MAG TPA: rRNA maturation RNase YbeY [Alphaproteobacteria bacterium]|nr:rRNA maturation RNase YbeY [Alphaproteobacteria bacterium]